MPQLKTRPAAVFFDLDGTLVDTADDLTLPSHRPPARTNPHIKSLRPAL